MRKINIERVLAMKKIGTITFHSSYNYGSHLQAYALQEFIKKISNESVDYKIINLRTQVQKEMYRNIFERAGLKNNLKKIFLFNYRRQLFDKSDNYEKFLSNKLQVTKEYSTYDELMKENFDYDYYISGSDQLWNLNARDFDWANYLEFVKNGKKISYSASFGPTAQRWDDEQKERIKKDLLKYDFLSVRELGSFNNIKMLINKEPEIHVDPTMLLEKEDWLKIIGDVPLLKKDYILFYDLKGKKEDLRLVKEISKKMKMPVVITKYMSMKIHFSNFEKHYYCGPIEFLNLLYNSKLVLSSSFHGNVFSVIFNKPFFALNGKNDFRISTMLDKFKLSDRSITLNELEEKLKNVYNIKFSDAQKIFNIERKKSEEYLKKALDLK